MLFGPRPLALFDRLWLVAVSMLVLYLISQNIHQTHEIRANGAARACASYGADEVAFDKNLALLDRFHIPPDDDGRMSLAQARDQKITLRAQLHCAPYPPAPSVPSVPGG